MIPISTEAYPSRKRIAYTAQPQRPGKIISAASRYNENRRAKLHQLMQVTVDGAIAAEEQDHIHLIGGSRQADAPVDFFACVFICLEWLKVFRRTSQPEDGSSAHVRG